MATRSRSVELAITVVTLALVALLGGFLLIALWLAGRDAPAPLVGSAQALPWAGLVIGLAVGGIGARQGHLRGRAMLPWALLGATGWLVAVVFAFAG